MQLNFSYENYPGDELWKIKPELQYIMEKVSENSDTLSSNYTSERFYKDDILFVSIIYKDFVPFEASTVITRDVFNGGCRVLNRLMVVPDQREKKIARGIPDTTLTMLKSQVEHVLESYDFAFISRELNSHRFVKRFAHDASNFMLREWHYEKDKHLVCKNNATGSSCWQHVAWTGKYLNLGRLEY